MSSARFGLFLFFALALAASFAQGGAITVSRQTALYTTGAITGDSFDLTDSLHTFGPYDNTIGNTLSPESGGTTSAQATQQSNVDTTVTGSASGTAAAQVAELDAISASAKTIFILLFDVIDQAETLSLDGSMSATRDATARIVLVDVSDISEPFLREIGVGEESPISFDENVVLEPGRYQLTAQAILSGTPTPNNSSFNVSFNVTTTPGTPIPLPAAVWPGMVALGAAGAAIRRAALR